MKLSARNILKGKIVEVTKGQTTAHVRIDVGGSIVTSSITNDIRAGVRPPLPQAGDRGNVRPPLVSRARLART